MGFTSAIYRTWIGVKVLAPSGFGSTSRSLFYIEGKKVHYVAVTVRVFRNNKQIFFIFILFTLTK